MNTIEITRRENNEIVTAAIYISCTKSFDSEKVIAEQLNLLHQFVQSEDLIIVDSYIDRDSTENYNRLVADAQNKYFDVVLICGGTSAVAGLQNIPIINILSAT